LRHLTEPEINKPHYTRVSTGANLQAVLGALDGWGGDETTTGLAFQVIHNMTRESDDTSTQAPAPSYNGQEITDLRLTLTKIRGDVGPKINTQAQEQLYKLEMENHAIERITQTIHNHSSQHFIALSMGNKILQTLTPEGYSLAEITPLDQTPL